jgi:hypothetical protein
MLGAWAAMHRSDAWSKYGPPALLLRWRPRPCQLSCGHLQLLLETCRCKAAGRIAAGSVMLWARLPLANIQWQCRAQGSTPATPAAGSALSLSKASRTMSLWSNASGGRSAMGNHLASCASSCAARGAAAQGVAWPWGPRWGGALLRPGAPGTTQVHSWRSPPNMLPPQQDGRSNTCPTCTHRCLDAQLAAGHKAAVGHGDSPAARVAARVPVRARLQVYTRRGARHCARHDDRPASEGGHVSASGVCATAPLHWASSCLQQQHKQAHLDEGHR